MVEEAEVEELKSSVTKCVMCKVGKVSPVTRTGQTKADLVIYGRSGMRMARHIESRCMVRGCRAGYFHGYMTYQGHTVYDDAALKVLFFPPIAYCFKQMFNQGKVLVTSSQTGFDVEYLVELAARIHEFR